MPSDGHILEGTVYPEREQTEWEMVHWGATTHTLYTFSSIICTRQKRKIPILESLAAPIKTSSWYYKKRRVTQ